MPARQQSVVRAEKETENATARYAAHAPDAAPHRDVQRPTATGAMSRSGSIPATLPYYGGKRGHGKAQWICDLLPWRFDSTYIEPFGGMAGVLVTRSPVAVEIFNDINPRVSNWHQCVRDEPELFDHLVSNTPHSRREFEWAAQHIDDEDLSPVRRALAFHIIIQQRVNHGDGKIFTNEWTPRYVASGGWHTTGRWRPGRVEHLSERMRRVEIQTRDALDILDEYAGVENTVIYIDPPYPMAKTLPYMYADVDLDALATRLVAQQGFVAVSGSADEWDHLGWERHVKPTAIRFMGSTSNREAGNKNEVLWTNYDARLHGLGQVAIA